jgi:hypothetical protein
MDIYQEGVQWGTSVMNLNLKENFTQARIFRCLSELDFFGQQASKKSVSNFTYGLFLLEWVPLIRVRDNDGGIHFENLEGYLKDHPLT